MTPVTRAIKRRSATPVRIAICDFKTSFVNGPITMFSLIGRIATHLLLKLSGY